MRFYLKPRPLERHGELVNVHILLHILAKTEKQNMSEKEKAVSTFLYLVSSRKCYFFWTCFLPPVINVVSVQCK